MVRMPEKFPALSIVIAVHNERGNLKELFHELLLTIREKDEVIFVNDASNDDTESVLQKICAEEERFTTISLPLHSGQTAALFRGTMAANNDFIVTMDGDLQSDPQDILKLIEAYIPGDTMVCGWRRYRHDPVLRKVLPSVFANAIVRFLFQISTHDIGCSMRLMPKREATELLRVRDAHRYLPILFHLRGYRVEEIVVNHRPRFYGRSHYGILRFAKVLYDLVRIKISSLTPITLPRESRIPANITVPTKG